jgi:hypothetical protein
MSLRSLLSHAISDALPNYWGPRTFDSVAAIFPAGPLDQVFAAQAPLREQTMGRWIAIIDQQPQLVLPPARRAEGVELVLSEDVGREPVRIRAGPPFRVRQQVDLAVHLLEGLHDLPAFQEIAPRQDLVVRDTTWPRGLRPSRNHPPCGTSVDQLPA